MGKVTGFLEYDREVAPRRDPQERIKDWFEIYKVFPHVERASARHAGNPAGMPSVAQEAHHG
jgi:hypothetical protein